MSITNAHLTDEEIADLAQPMLDKIFHGVSLVPMRVEARSLYVNQSLLSCRWGTVRDFIRRELNATLPAYTEEKFFDDAEDWLLERGYLPYVSKGELKVIFSRPDKSSSLLERISSCTGINPENLAINPNSVSCGFDNLELRSRIYEIFNFISDVGASQLQTQADFNRIKLNCSNIVELPDFYYIQYLSTLKAREDHLGSDENLEVLRLHEATCHIAAFTKVQIPYGYMAFMDKLELPILGLLRAYINVFKELDAIGYGPATAGWKQSTLTPLTADDLFPAMTKLLDRYVSKMSDNSGRKFSAFHRLMTLNGAYEEEHDIVKGLTDEQKILNTERLIVFRTLNALYQLMGVNTPGYVPQRPDGSFARVKRFLHLSCS